MQGAFLRAALVSCGACVAARDQLVPERRLDSDMGTSHFQVKVPSSLSKSDGYDHKQAQFGISMHKDSLETVTLVSAEDSLCATDSYDDSTSFPHGPWSDFSSLFVVLLETGSCSFVTQVRNAQTLGAAAAVVVAPASDDDEHLPPMVDDGTGSNVHIPSVLIGTTDGAVLKTTLESEEDVRVSLKWFQPRTDGTAALQLWTSPANAEAQTFIDQFKGTAVALGSSLTFEPVFYVTDLSDESLCTNNFRYCSPDPDGLTGQGVSGSDVVVESLRRKCVHSVAQAHMASEAGEANWGVADAEQDWWTYVEAFNHRCGTAEDFSDAACRSSVFASLNVVTESDVEACMADSGGTSDDLPNSLLQQDLEAATVLNIAAIPTVYINGVKLQGSVRPASVLASLCGAFATGAEPSACSCSSSTTGDDLDRCIDQLEDHGDTPLPTHGKSGSPGEEGGVVWWVVLIIVVGTVLLVGTVAFIYWRRTQNQMRDQVRGILAEYMPLDEFELSSSASHPSAVQPRPFGADLPGGV